MEYPTFEEVDEAHRIDLARWFRFLPSPGTSAMGRPMEEFKAVLEHEKAVMDRLCKRFNSMGGMCPEISKAIGWGR